MPKTPCTLAFGQRNAPWSWLDFIVPKGAMQAASWGEQGRTSMILLNIAPDMLQDQTARHDMLVGSVVVLIPVS